MHVDVVGSHVSTAHTVTIWQAEQAVAAGAREANAVAIVAAARRCFSMGEPEGHGGRGWFSGSGAHLSGCTRPRAREPGSRTLSVLRTLIWARPSCRPDGEEGEEHRLPASG